MAYTRGALEFAFKITERATGEETVVMSTPSMWALANEYQDKLLAGGKHTNGWALGKYITVLSMLAAAKAGLIKQPKGIPTLDEQAQFVNLFDVSEVSEEYAEAEGDDVENPTKSDQEGDQEAQ